MAFSIDSETGMVQYNANAGGGSDIDLSGITATPSSVLNSATFMNSSGQLLSGTIQTVTATLSNNVVTVPAGHIKSKQTLTVAEAATPTVSGNIVTVNKGYQAAQKKVTVGTALAAKTYTPGSSPIAIKAGQYLTGDQTIEAVQAGGGIEFYECADDGGGSSAGGTWSGYKMVWSEGEAGSDIIVTFKDGSTKTFVTTNNKQWNCVDNPDEWSGWFIGYLDEGRYGNIYTGWCLYMTGGSDEGHYANVTADADATIEEICAGPWIADDYGSSNSIPTFTSAGSPAGWAKTDELVEGLAISGYTPKVGTIYNADTTVEIKRMFDGTTWDYVVYMPLEADFSVAATGQPITKIGSPVYAVSGGIECLKLDGESGLAIPDSAVDLSGDLTICCRAKYETLQDGVLFHLGTAANQDLLIMNDYSGSSWTVGTAAGSGAFSVPSNIIGNQWYNIVLVRSGEKLKLYQDGVLLGEDDWDVVITPRGTVSIGCGYYSGDYTWYFSGYMSKFMIFNRALSEEEIKKVLA